MNKKKISLVEELNDDKVYTGLDFLPWNIIRTDDIHIVATNSDVVTIGDVVTTIGTTVTIGDSVTIDSTEFMFNGEATEEEL